MSTDTVEAVRVKKSAQDRIASALMAIPGISSASLPAPISSIAMPMHLCLDSLSVQVPAANGGKGVFAKAVQPGALYPFTFSDAAAGSAAAGDAGVAPRLLAASPDEQVLVFELLDAEWRMALASDMRKPDVKAAILSAKKAWHRQERLPRSASPFEVARNLSVKLKPHLDKHAPLHIPFKGAMPFQSALQWIERMEAALCASGTDTTPVHGENVASNVMIGPAGRILLVDFDRATNADPISDLGALCLDFCRNDRERMEAVEIYWGRADRAVLSRVKLYGIVDDFSWACWALLAETDPSRAGPEWFKYASNRLLRMNHHLQTFDMIDLLASV